MVVTSKATLVATLRLRIGSAISGGMKAQLNAICSQHADQQCITLNLGTAFSLGEHGQREGLKDRGKAGRDAQLLVRTDDLDPKNQPDGRNDQQRSERANPDGRFRTILLPELGCATVERTTAARDGDSRGNWLPR